MSRLPVVGAAYSHGRSEVTARSAVNLWFETRPEGEKAPVVVSHLPQKDNHNPQGRFGDVYGWVVWNNLTAYAVASTHMRPFVPGDAFVGTPVAFPGSGVFGLDNLESAVYGNSVVMVAGNHAWHYPGAPGVITEITTMPVPVGGIGPVGVTYLGGYFVALLYGGRICWSPDGLTWGALDFATAEFGDDRGIKILTVGGLLVIFGGKTIEFWSPTGNADLPFAPMKGTVIKLGAYSASAVCLINGQAYLWGAPDHGSQGLYVLNGSQPQRLSSPDIERAIGEAGIVSIGGFALAGHTVVAVRPRLGAGGDETWWFDTSVGAWTKIPVGAPYYGVTLFTTTTQGRRVCGLDTANGLHFSMDLAGTADGYTRELTTDNVVSPDLDRFTVDKVRLDYSGSGTVTITCSHDGGLTWGFERTTLANDGVRGIVQFDNFGTSTQFTFRIRSTGRFLLSNLIINPKN